MAIATGNDRNSYEETKQRFHPFFDNFSHAVVGGDELVAPKPSPDIYVKAFDRFSPKPESLANVLVFEDNCVGVEAAVSAGMKCVLVVDERLNSCVESKTASLVIRSVTEFKPQEFGLPPK